ncbi:hypothetical protein NFI96_006026 [Prochilodus magdalenae]|nr:hypothetical protein NFI96_006026 [Prochilodus magdalenae]
MLPLTWANQISANRHSASKTLYHHQPPSTVSEMERPWGSLSSHSPVSSFIGCVFAGVGFSLVSGAEVERRLGVRLGDDVTLYSDCVWRTGSETVWFRNSSCQHEPPLLIMPLDLMGKRLPRYSAVWNPSNGTHDLLVKNVSESDLGLYYCAIRGKKITKDGAGVIRSEDVYQYGNRTTRLSLPGKTPHSEICKTIIFLVLVFLHQ